jgi:hypothetical protein
LGLSHNDLFDKGVDPSASPRHGCHRRRKNFRSRSLGDDLSQLREETMKVVVAFAGLAIGFALPTYAQQNAMVPDQQVIQELVALGQKY